MTVLLYIRVSLRVERRSGKNSPQEIRSININECSFVKNCDEANGVVFLADKLRMEVIFSDTIRQISLSCGSFVVI